MHAAEDIHQPVPSLQAAAAQLDQSPSSPGPSLDSVDSEADMVEQAALARQSTDSSEQSSAPSVDSEGDQAPLELRMPSAAAKYACNGP